MSVNLLPIWDACARAQAKQADNGDREAMSELHQFLADWLRSGKATPYMLEMVADMHAELARGRVSADTAMLTKPVHGRAIEGTRDTRLYAWIDEREGDAPLKTIYDKAAAEFGISASRAKKIFEAIRRELREAEGY